MLIDETKMFSYDIELKLNIVKEFGFDLKPDSVVLDFGCGSGDIVRELHEHGYRVFGCDINVDSEKDIVTKSLIEQGIIREIKLDPYRLPFEDNTFDLIISHSVFEHVKNYSETNAEISRVLKPDGSCLHTFVSRLKPIETHVLVPFSSVIQSYAWIYFWVFLGVRNEWTDSHSVKERTLRYYNYLKNKTNYLSKNSLQKHFSEHFGEVIFCERKFLRYSRRGRILFRLSKALPFIPFIYSTFHSRVVFAGLPKKALNTTMVFANS
jgi:SAM-dependent methyltransferase